MLTAATAAGDCPAGDMFADEGRTTRVFAGGIDDEEYELWAATEGRKFIRMSEARACSDLGQDEVREVSHAAHCRSNSISF